jgi:hypothetical protein
MWVGFNTVWLEYENIERAAGETKWSFWKLAAYAVEGIVSFSTVPLRIATVTGCIVSAMALIYMVVRVVIAMIWGNPVAAIRPCWRLCCASGGSSCSALRYFRRVRRADVHGTKRRPIYIQKESILNNSSFLKKKRSKRLRL